MHPGWGGGRKEHVHSWGPGAGRPKDEKRNRAGCKRKKRKDVVVGCISARSAAEGAAAPIVGIDRNNAERRARGVGGAAAAAKKIDRVGRRLLLQPPVRAHTRQSFRRQRTRRQCPPVRPQWPPLTPWPPAAPRLDEILSCHSSTVIGLLVRWDITSLQPLQPPRRSAPESTAAAAASERGLPRGRQPPPRGPTRPAGRRARSGARPSSARPRTPSCRAASIRTLGRHLGRPRAQPPGPARPPHFCPLSYICIWAACAPCLVAMSVFVCV